MEEVNALIFYTQAYLNKQQCTPNPHLFHSIKWNCGNPLVNEEYRVPCVIHDKCNYISFAANAIQICMLIRT